MKDSRKQRWESSVVVLCIVAIYIDSSFLYLLKAFFIAPFMKYVYVD